MSLNNDISNLEKIPLNQVTQAKTIPAYIPSNQLSQMGRMRYCGREFTPSDVHCIRQLISNNPIASRFQLSRLVCKQFDWRRANGLLKDMSCRVAMLRMHEDGLLRLPPPRNGNNNGKPYFRRTLKAQPEPELWATSPRELGQLIIQPVTSRNQSHLWNEYIARYHYLGYQPLPGAQIRYMILAKERIVSLLGFGAAAWKTQPRDIFIGWTSEQRHHNLHLVVNNARFLILPWVHCKNLASCLLGMASQRLARDWQARYGYHPVLLETFVQLPRFSGVCYKAANWQFIGKTKGRGKLDTYNQALVPQKAIWVYPLNKQYRKFLCA